MRVLEVHKKLLDQQIIKLEREKYDVKRNTYRPVYIRADSKGRCLLPHINHYNRLNLIYRGGAKISNEFLQTCTLIKIAKERNPVIILWFGTCEMTEKKGRYIFLSNNLDEKLDQIKHEYIAYKQQIITTNPNSKVIFLDCPFQSILIWNFIKGHPHPGSFTQDQKTLELYTTKLNCIIKEINGDQVVPRIAQDISYSVKKKRRSARYLKNYKLMYDGVHPGKTLSRLWYLRIMRMLSFA